MNITPPPLLQIREKQGGGVIIFQRPPQKISNQGKTGGNIKKNSSDREYDFRNRESPELSHKRQYDFSFSLVIEYVAGTVDSQLLVSIQIVRTPDLRKVEKKRSSD